MPRPAAALAVALIAAACSNSPPSSAEPHAGHSTEGSSGSTADAHAGHEAGESGASATPHPSAPAGADGTIVLETDFAVGGGGMEVADALEAAVSQPVLVNGILLRDDNGGIWFCAALGGDDPPACGQPVLWVTNFPADEAVFAPENALATGAQTEGGVTWIPDQQLFGVVHSAP